MRLIFRWSSFGLFSLLIYRTKYEVTAGGRGHGVGAGVN